jgi:Uncharacterised protein conserved in bacteria (DUF2336)
VADEVTSLLALARAKAAERNDRLEALAAELYGAPRGLLTDSERSLMTGMIHGLVDSVAAALRARLAERLAGNGRAAEALARLPLDALLAPLRQSSFLSDPGLIDAAYHRLLEYQLESHARDRARVARPGAPGAAADLSDPVAALLAQAGEPAGRALTAFLIAEAKRRDAYRNPLLLPADMQASAVAHLFWAVAVVIRDALAPGVPDDAAELDDAIEAATADALDVALAGGEPEARPDALAVRLDEAGLAGPDRLSALLRGGEVGLFEAILSRLTGIERALLRRFLFEPGGEALAVCARAVGIPRDDLAAILAATRDARQRPRAVSGGEVAAALAQYDSVSPEAANRLMRHWGRRRDFLWMLRRLASGAGGSASRTARI